MSSASDSSMIHTKEMKQRVTELENDLQLRSIQINDIQQKILAADQGGEKCNKTKWMHSNCSYFFHIFASLSEEKGKIRWNAIQSMVEAKYGLRFLFDTVRLGKSNSELWQNLLYM